MPSAVVLEHGGDIYAMTGDINRAVELWQQALLYTDDRQDILMQKIQKRKYIND
jgi:predicted negative regulator of RcsB-dependent stress response